MSQNKLKTSMERLSSGLRINSAKDDAAGLAISDRMTSQIRGLNQAVRNANDGISLAQTAEGAMQEDINILQRIRELAVQSANDTNSAADRASLQAEVSQLVSEMSRIGNTTEFNGIKLLDGSFNQQQFQVGANANETVSITMNSVLPTVLGVTTVSTYELEITDYDMDTSAWLINGAFTGQTNNSTASHDIVGGLEPASVAINSNETVKDLVDQIMSVEGDTGVSATGETKVRLLSQIQDAATVYPATWTFDLTGASTSTVTAVFSDASSMEPLVGAINSEQSSTGIFAEYDASNDDVILTSTDGYNVAIGNIQVQDSSGPFLNDLEYRLATTGLLFSGPYDGRTQNDTNPHVITGPDGNATVSLNSNETAKDLVDLVNAQTLNTGVASTAEARVLLGSFSITASPSTISFTLTGSSSAVITYTLTDDSSTPLVIAINDASDVTGITAIYDDSNDTVMLTSNEGYNITLNGLSAVDGSGNDVTTSPFRMTAVNPDGPFSGSAPLRSDLDIGYTFGGYIEYTSDESFIVEHNGTTYNSTSDAPTPLNNSLTFGGVDKDGFLSGSVVTLDSGVTDETYTIGGYLSYSSRETFSVVHQGVTYDSIADIANPVTEIDEDFVSEIDISTREGATEAITVVDSGISQIDGERSELGAVQNRFESIISNLQNISENLAAARSRIMDADIAAETSELTKQNILQQAGVSILSQANQQPQLALSLLQNI